MRSTKLLPRSWKVQRKLSKDLPLNFVPKLSHVHWDDRRQIRKVQFSFDDVQRKRYVKCVWDIRQSWKTSAHACSWLFLARFRSFHQWKFTPLNNVVLAGDFLAITTFDMMELDEFWEQSNSTRSLWDTEHFMHWVVSCTKTIFFRSCTPSKFSVCVFQLCWDTHVHASISADYTSYF